MSQSGDSDFGNPFAAARHLDTPLLLIDADILRRNVAALRAAFPDAEVWYALKCNPDPRIAANLAALSVGFEIASSNELRALQALGVPAQRLMCLHPIKSPDFVRELHDAGVSVLAVDCREEIEKVAALAPGSAVLTRIECDGAGSRIPLAGKFGCTPEHAVELAGLARRFGLRPAGVTLHVGSQCESLAAWKSALLTCRAVCEQLASARIPAELVSLGGGFPVPYTADVPALSTIGDLVREVDPRRFGAAGCRLTIEPGRGIAATAGTLIASVVGTATRAGVRWVYLDAGTHHGLFEWLAAAGGLTMPITVEHADRPIASCRLAGPTCSGYDVLPGLFDLPELRLGDRIAFHHAGAYSTATATRFNGFDGPAIVLTDGDVTRPMRLS